MGMWIFQKPYDAIDRFKCRWFCSLMGMLQKNVLWPALKSIGEAGKSHILMKIEEAAKANMSGKQKFAFVFNATRERFDVDEISDDWLNNVIANLYSNWKVEKENK